MGDPRILIVDDEESVLKILKDSLKKEHADIEVVTVTDGYTALEQLSNGSFELVVTDYKMAGMDGLELLETIRDIQPATRVILITAYGNDEIESEARRLQAYKYLAKPLQLNTFRQIVDEALHDIALSRPGILILSDERYREVIKLLTKLQGDISARSAFLVNADGHIIAQTGVTNDFPVTQIATLLRGGIAALLEAGRVLDADGKSINLAYSEGAKECLYAINIGDELMLLLVAGTGPYSSRVGSVWYYAQQAVMSLRRTLGEAEFASPKKVFIENFEEEIDKELEDMLSDNPMHSREVEEEQEKMMDSSLEEDFVEKNSTLLSFSEAVDAGLIQGQVARDDDEAKRKDVGITKAEGMKEISSGE